jgi:NAD(P)-dependent dehydrogenase (short-subunit alcohol dehydrogenase family)
MSSTPKVWLITGTSKGFGRVWAEAALERGDRVAATARDISTLAPLVEAHGEAVEPIALDMNDKAAIDAAVAQAHERFGRLDVVVNNAGYGLFGTTEEVSEEQARRQIETNLFGPLWMTQAVLPIMRAQGSGHVIQVTSVGGVLAFPGLGLYHASKWGLEAFSQSLAVEVAPFGIKVTIVEPGGYATDWRGPSAVNAERNPAYEQMWEQMTAMFAAASGRRGDPQATGPAILQLVDAEQPTLRVFFGDGPLAMVRGEYARRIGEWEQWEELSIRAHGAKAG